MRNLYIYSTMALSLAARVEVAILPVIGKDTPGGFKCASKTEYETL